MLVRYLMTGIFMVTGWMVAGLAVVDASEPLHGGVQVQLHINQDRGVVGLDLRVVSHQPPLVVAVFPFSPAEKAGVRVGDMIWMIDGVSALGLSRQAVDDAISDVPGTWVELTLMRDGTEHTVVLQVKSIRDLSPGLQGYYNQP